MICLASVSGATLLLQFWSLVSLRASILVFFVPTALALLVWSWRGTPTTNSISDVVVTGAFGGLIGTLAYDLFRIPFMFLGYRVFLPIRIYGVWIADAGADSWLTDLLGWCYHFSNGISFGVMYVAFARGRHYGFAIAWGLILETIALLSPFGSMFGFRGNIYAIAIAYLGHVAYGYPLGKLSQHLVVASRRVALFTVLTLAVGTLVFFAAIIGAPRWSINQQEGTHFIVDKGGIRPDIARIFESQSVEVKNGAEAPIVVLISGSVNLTLDVQKTEVIHFESRGIYRLRQADDSIAWSSCIVVDRRPRFRFP